VAASRSAAWSAVVFDGGRTILERLSSQGVESLPRASSTIIRSSVGDTVIFISGLSYVRPLGKPTNTAVPSLLVPEADANACTPQGRTGISRIRSSDSSPTLAATANRTV